MSTVFLFKFPEYIPLVKWDSYAPNINWPMIQYDTKVYKGASNSIDFVIRNNDRKPIKLVDYQLQAEIQQVNSPSNNQGFLPEVLLVKNCVVIDELMGKARLDLQPEDIQHWNPGYYRYVIKITDGQNRSEYLYTDINKNTFGNFELKEGVVSSLAPSIELDASKFTPTPVDSFTGTVFISSGVAGDAQTGRANGTHTIAVYQTRFQGKFWIQGSLNNEPPLPNEWFDIQIGEKTPYYQFTPSNNALGPTLFNFTMNVYWLRFIYQPIDANQGVFLKVLYKG